MRKKARKTEIKPYKLKKLRKRLTVAMPCVSIGRHNTEKDWENDVLLKKPVDFYRILGMKNLSEVIICQPICQQRKV